MPESDLDVQIQSSIAGFVAEVNGLVREAAIEAVREALGEGSAAPRRGRPRKKTARKGRRKPARKAVKRAGKKPGKRVRRTGAQVEQLAARVLGQVRSNPGQRLGEIAKALEVATKEARRPAFMLVELKKLRTEGQRSGTRYFAGGGRKKAGKATKRGKRSKRKTTRRRKTKKVASKPAAA